MSSLLSSQSSSRAGRPRTKGANALSGGTDAGLVRGVLSGTMGASPFGVLATAPELPAGTTTCLTTSAATRSPPNASRPGHSGLSLRRVNSSGAGNLSRSTSGAVTPVAAGPTRRGAYLWQVGLAIMTLQVLLACCLLYRPSLARNLTSMVNSASFTHDSQGHVPGLRQADDSAVDGSATMVIVARMAADSRRTVQPTTISRRERMWPTLIDLNARVQGRHQTTSGADSQQQDDGATGRRSERQAKGAPASAQPVRLASASSAKSTADHAAKAMEGKAVEAKMTTANSQKGKAATAADTQAVAAAGVAKASNAESTSVKGEAAAANPLQSFPPFVKPVVPFPGRVANPPPIVGVVFYGRRDRVRILDCYLQRNMMRNGGLLVYVVFVTATWQPEDVEFLDRLIAKRAGDYRKLYPQRIDKGYTGHYAWMDPDTMYVKIDDDVVYFADHAIDHMLIAHNLNRYHLISANVINHQPLELPHSQAGAHFTYEQARPGDKSSWRPVMRPLASWAQGPAKADRPAMEPVPFMDNGWDVWGDWRRAANVHYSFLANHAANRLNVYDFPADEQLWDFNRHFGYTRWRINMIMFKGATIDVHVYNMSSTVETYPGDDEDWITRLLPQKLNRTSAAVSPALAVHFSFFMQRAGLENNTDLLDRYTLLAERTCGRLVPASPI